MGAYVIQSNTGLRIWQAEDADHAVEQHRDAFPDEPVLGVGIAVKASSEWRGIILNEMDLTTASLAN